MAVEQLKPLAYRPTQAAEVANVSRPVIYQWMRIPGFPAAKIGGCTVIPVRAFEQWLNQQAGVDLEISREGV